MTTQPEALRLADRCKSLSQIADAYSAEAYEQAAAELSRLSAVEAQRDALLEALKALYDEQEGPPLIRRHRQWQAAMDKARAAIKAVEEKA